MNRQSHIYSIRSACGKGFAYSCDCGPIDDIDFFESIHPIVRQRLKYIWMESGALPGIVVDDYGVRWPDVLQCENPPPAQLLSEKILKSIQSHNISLKKFVEIPVGEVLSQKLQRVAAPRYYFVEAENGISIDYAASGIGIDENGDPELPIGREVFPLFDPATWTGLDIFRCDNWPLGGRDLLCTERVKEIASAEKWSNVEFVRQRLKGVDPFTGQPIKS